jgi:hypothetical protein
MVQDAFARLHEATGEIRKITMATSFRLVSAAIVACGLLSTAAVAQVTDPEATCADYLKTVASAGGTPKTGDAAMDKMAADVDAKMKVYCTANPKAKAMDAAMKAMGG